MSVTQPKLPRQPNFQEPVLSGNQLTQAYAALFREMLAYIAALEARLTAGGL
jgi:hypothetical protein